MGEIWGERDVRLWKGERFLGGIMRGYEETIQSGESFNVSTF